MGHAMIEESEAMDQYTINLVNQSAVNQVFWVFLAPPQELAYNPGVFANSSAAMVVAPNAPSPTSITIPVQYIVGAGASKEAVGLNVVIDSDIVNNSDLSQTWQVNYANVPPPEGPNMELAGATGPDNIAITANEFDQPNNEGNGWFASMSFGIQTSSGFVGMTWSPAPGQTLTMTPVLNFYVTTGNFSNNALTDWDTIQQNSAYVSVPTDFAQNACTVTLTSNGNWNVTPGAMMGARADGVERGAGGPAIMQVPTE
ncbi:hypothetical protein P1X14_08235 [Sphingomonas sp. AOB5]|uniref:hypothetical protein n=1 Tax=Sphingomonas sp. AOB5 TaxID=3034017 RepID=UPI0023F90AD1|nr:hypothetical protein [Sphingomonas sp. AOB5]MDF7775231.1 hypothetical protein [Sphingomonas sp. AOB5]